MSVFVDCHVHLYSSAVLAGVYASAWENALSACAQSGSAPPDQVALLLTEREGQEWLRSTLADLPTLPNLSIRSSPEGSALIITSPLEPRRPLFLVSGRQFVSQEGLEVLSLCLNLETEPRLPAEELIEAIVSAGGIACLPWSPGKWWFARGKTLRRLCAQFRGAVTLGDIPMRPSIFPGLPTGRSWAKGLPVLAGTDPLPLENEENAIASYGVLYAGEVDEGRPGFSLTKLLLTPGKLTGRRNSLREAASRWIRLRKSAKSV